MGLFCLKILYGSLILFSLSNCTSKIYSTAEKQQAFKVLRAAQANYMKKDFQEARDAYNFSYEIYPTSAALNGAGVCSYYLGDLPAAEKLFIAAWEQERKDFQALFNLARIYEEHDRISLARKLYQYIVRMNPENYQSRNNLAVLLSSDSIKEKLRVKYLLNSAKLLKADSKILRNLKIIN